MPDTWNSSSKMWHFLLSPFLVTEHLLAGQEASLILYFSQVQVSSACISYTSSCICLVGPCNHVINIFGVASPKQYLLVNKLVTCFLKIHSLKKSPWVPIVNREPAWVHYKLSHFPSSSIFYHYNVVHLSHDYYILEALIALV